MWRAVVVCAVVGIMVLTLHANSAACKRSDYHIVQNGDTLWKIAMAHNTTVQSLCKANGLSEQSIIHPGDKLIIPQKSPSATTGLAPNLRPGMKMLVRATNVNVRCGPSTSSKRIGMVERGDVGTVVKTCGQWVKASFRKKGITGWVKTDFIEACKQPSEQAAEQFVVRHRTQWSAVKNARTVCSKARSAVECRQKHHSAIAADHASSKMASHVSHPNMGELLAATAQRYIGTPYRRASSYPSRGFDCSGFVYYLLLRFGVIAPRTASAMFGIGKPVKRTELRPGDLVFFKTTSSDRVTHVGIYIGDGKFVHASSGAGRVTVSPLTHGYYANRYAGARRVIE